MKLRHHLDSLFRFCLKYGGGVVAWAALAVSMVSLYWTEHTVDDFRVIPFSNKFDWSPDGGSLSSTIVGMFINNGTRSAAVTKISMGITHFTASDYDNNATGFFGEPTEEDCKVSPNDANIFRYDIAPFVVGKEEIVSQTTSLRQINGYPPSISQLPGNGNELLLCLKFGIALPDRTFETILKPWIGQNCSKQECVNKLVGGSPEPIDLLH